jgi:PIN domain nuclease of toxin-antitoxin system
MGVPPAVKLLLDTQIWIWAEVEPHKLGGTLRRSLEKPGNELYLSPVSIWEASYIEQRGRWHAKRGFSEWLAAVMRDGPYLEAPFTFEVGREAAGIRLPQPDAGDVFLAATARVYGLTLVTADAQLLACSWLKTLPND